MRALLIAALMVATPALAQQQQCGPTDGVHEHFMSRYGEGSVGIGTNPIAQFEVLVNPESGSWTILIHRGDGVSCIVAAGTDWQSQGLLIPSGVRL